MQWTRSIAVGSPMLLALAATSCSAHCPPCAALPPQTVVAKAPECHLPELPAPPSKLVGFPSPDGQNIFVSRSDWAQLVGIVEGMSNWIVAAVPCLEQPR